MEAMLKKRSVSKYSRVFTTEFTGESTTETVVPDVLPDISEILYVSGTVLLRSKTTGEGKVSLSGSISVSAVYLPDGETGLRSIQTTMPFAAEAEDEAITEGCRTVVSVKLTSIDARMINTRKLSVRAEVLLQIDCYAADILTLTEDISTDSEGLLHVRKESSEICVVRDIREKTFVVSDEYILSAGADDVREILSHQTSILIDEVKYVGSKLILRGSAATRLLCSSGDELVPVEISFSTPFSQILEMDAAGEDADTSYRAMLTAAYYEPVTNSEHRRSISMELHLVVQAVCSSNEICNVVSDVYSNRCICQCAIEQIEHTALVRRQITRSTVKETVKTPTPVNTVVYAHAQVISFSETTAKIRVSGIYLDEEGEYRAFKNSAVSQFDTGTIGDYQARIDCAHVAELYVSPESEGVELRISVEFEIIISSSSYLPEPCEPELCEMQGGEAPVSLYLVPKIACKDLWGTAKRYGSTVELIEKANESENSYGMLIVPVEV